MKNLFLLLFFGCVIDLSAQVNSPFYSAYSSGGLTNISSNGTYKHVGAIGQPIASPKGSGFFNASHFIFQSSVIDETPPNVSFNPLQFSLIKDQDNVFEASATDNLGLTSFYIYYRPISKLAFDSTQLISTTGGKFAWTITPESFPDGYDNMGMEYYLKAKDSRNFTRFPLSGSFFEYLITSDTRLNIPAFGTETKKYRIISIPFDQSNNSVLSVFGEFAELKGKKEYRMFHFADGNYVEMPYDLNEITRGKGYFLLVKDPLEIKLEEQTAPDNNRSKLFEMTLQPGWNMVGNPYPVSISWEDVKAANGDPSDLGDLRKFTGNWVTNPMLAPYEGGFVYNSGNSPMDILIPFLGQQASGGRKSHSFSEDINTPNWIVNLKLENGEVEGTGSFGMNEEADDNIDKFDDFNVPRFIEYAEVAFPHPEHPLKFFSNDVVKTTDEFVWRLELVSSSQSEFVITWDNTKFGEGKKELYLFDVQRSLVVDMRSHSQYSFDPSLSGKFKIYYGEENTLDKIGPDDIEFVTPHPNPFDKEAPILFKVNLPVEETVAGVPYVVVTNLIGEEVFRHTLILVGSNKYELAWSGIGLSNDHLPSGVYIYNVICGSRSESGKIIFRN